MKQNEAMKRILLTLLLAATMAGTYAQEDVWKHQKLNEINLLYVDTLTLDSLFDHWNAYVEVHPKDEQAWRNLYEIIFTKKLKVTLLGEGKVWRGEWLMNVVKRMEAAIPDTYTFNYCAFWVGYENEKYRGEQHDFWEWYKLHFQYAERAVDLMPGDLQEREYYSWATQLITQRSELDTVRITKLLTRYFESGQYPADVLQYHFNELQGMDKGGIFLGDVEGDVIGKYMLQFVLGVHRDKIIFCEKGCELGQYLKKFFLQAGLSQDFFDPEGELAKTYEQFARLQLIYRYICEHATRPVYTSATCINSLLFGELPEDLKARFYNEGLTMRYSAKPYDNLAVKRRNVEERYRLEYLRLSFCPSEWINTAGYQGDARRTFNYLLLLNDLMPYYKAYSPKRYVWLNGLFTDMLLQMKRQNKNGLLIEDSVFIINEVEEGGHYVEVMQVPYKEIDDKIILDDNPAHAQVFFKTEPVK